MNMTHTVILGAGPTGLGAALRLLELGETDFLLFEAESQAGGLAGSFVDQRGFTWDLGGHVQFSHYAAFDRFMHLALGDEGWLDHERESWVWMQERFVPYPFQYNLHRLPPAVRWDCARGLLEQSGLLGPEQPPNQAADPPRHFEDWILRTFGQGIADWFLLPYNFKVWAYPPRKLNAHWVGERVAVPDVAKVLAGICLEQDHLSWGPNNRFRFPRFGGTGAIWMRLAERIPITNKRFGATITAIDPQARHVTTADGQRIGYQALISTLPLDQLAQLLNDPALIELTARLLYSSVHVVGIGLRGQPPEPLRTKCWMYFPEDNCPFYRVTVFSNYSPNNVPAPGATWSLMAEVSESLDKPVNNERVVEDVIQGLINTHLIPGGGDIISQWHRRLDHGYPTPSVERDAVLEHVLPALEAQGIYSRGRFGAWKYEVSNQDHALMQGYEIAERLANGREELTLHQPNLINGRYNSEPFPEWEK